jgi:hypothetical protein
MSMKKSSEYRISVFERKEILEIILTGQFTESAAGKMTNEVMNTIIAKGFRNILVDIRELKGRLNIESVYWLVRRPLPEGPKINIVLLDSPDNSDFIAYFEIIAVDAGLPVKCFTDIADARNWLTRPKLNFGYYDRFICNPGY